MQEELKFLPAPICFRSEQAGTRAEGRRYLFAEVQAMRQAYHTALTCRRKRHELTRPCAKPHLFDTHFRSSSNAAEDIRRISVLESGYCGQGSCIMCMHTIIDIDTLSSAVSSAAPVLEWLRSET